jgi:SAM-dependent methyltransferase
MSCMNDERRLSFGEDAEQYDRARPSYPAVAVDAVCEGEDVRRVLDVGCGTGIASRLFVDRGCEVVGVEPDERMAAVARRRGVNVVITPFEVFSPPADPFDVVVSAQAWHWVDQDIGPTTAADALRPGGRLALMSNGYERGDARDELEAVYRRQRTRDSYIARSESKCNRLRISSIGAAPMFCCWRSTRLVSPPPSRWSLPTAGVTPIRTSTGRSTATLL